MLCVPAAKPASLWPKRFKRGNCADMLCVCTYKAARAFKPVLAVSGYLESWVQAGAVMLTAGEVVSKVCVLNDLPIVLLVLTPGGSLK